MNLKHLERRMLPLLAAFALTAAGASAQSAEKFTAAMEKFIAQMDEAADPATWQRLANSFDRVAHAEPDQWLAWYWAGYANCILAYSQTDVSMIDAIVDQADKQLARAAELSPDNPEVLVAQSMAASARIAVDPQTRGMTYGPKSGMLAQKARQLDPDNPRAHMQVGTGLLYTPEQFGGGKAKACPVLETAMARFETFEPASSIHPDWGEEYLANEVMPLCKSSHEGHDHGDHEGHDH